jgi:hypothetical protein
MPLEILTNSNNFYITRSNCVVEYEQEERKCEIKISKLVEEIFCYIVQSDKSGELDTEKLQNALTILNKVKEYNRSRGFVIKIIDFIKELLSLFSTSSNKADIELVPDAISNCIKKYGIKQQQAEFDAYIQDGQYIKEIGEIKQYLSKQGGSLEGVRLYSDGCKLKLAGDVKAGFIVIKDKNENPLSINNNNYQKALSAVIGKHIGENLFPEDVY